MTDTSREDLLERYGRWYGDERFAIAFTASNHGEHAKRVTTAGWDQTKPLPSGDYGAGYLRNRGLQRNPVVVLRPSNLVVLECDTEDDLLRIQALDLPVTITVRSSKPYKRHFYFRPPPELDRLPYVAFRFESGKLTADSGRYFLAPPSIHPTGAVYAFLPDLGPDDVDIAELPEQLYLQLSKQAAAETSEQRERIHVDPDAKVVAGQRGDSLFRYACMLRRWGLSYEQILEACLQWNDDRCDPPISRDRVVTQVDGAFKKQGDQEIAQAAANPIPDTSEPSAGEPPAPRSRSPVVLETWREFSDKATENVPCLVEGLWPERSLGFIASPPKKGKTWIALSLALSLATGVPFLDSFPIPQKRNVMYLALEGHRAALRARLACLARGMGTNPDVDPLDRIRLVYKPRGINISDPEWARHIIDAAASMDADLVIVDVLRAAALMKENAADDFATLRANLADLLDNGTSLAFLHHFTKTSETSKERTPMERMSGSGAMGGAMDVGLFITGSDDGARRLRIEFDIRDIATPDMTGVRLHGDGTGANGGFTHRDKAWWVKDEAADEDDVDHPAEELVAWVKAQGRDVTKTDIAYGCDCSVKTVTRREPRMEKLGVEIVRGRGKANVYRWNGASADDTLRAVEVIHTWDTTWDRTARTRDESQVNPLEQTDSEVGQPGRTRDGVPPYKSGDLQEKLGWDTQDSLRERVPPLSGDTHPSADNPLEDVPIELLEDAARSSGSEWDDT